MKYQIKVEHLPTGRVWEGNPVELDPQQLRGVKDGILPSDNEYGYILNLGEQGCHTWRKKALQELCISIVPAEPPKAYAVNFPDGTLAGIALTWDQAVEMARTMYIDRIEVEDAIEVYEAGKIYDTEN